ncbi:MAG TPA: SLC13 family permease [Gemmataceae bacterium]|nr:SLC13 family permease [Gemmataceae bacterium]
MPDILHDHWPGICAAIALIVLLVSVIYFHVHAVIALFVVSLGLGLFAGLAPAVVVDAIHKGIGDILRDVALLLAFGAILGRMLETSGAAELIARRMINAFGERNTSLAILLAAFLVGIPILFNVGFLVLIPIVWRLQRETKRSLLFYLCPLAFSLGITHSLVPPHPGIVGAVNTLAGQNSDRIMVETIIFGIALSLPLALIGWFGPGRFWAQRQMVTAPENMSVPDDKKEPPVARSLALALTIILAPLVLSVLGFGASMLRDRNPPAWLADAPFETTPRYLGWLNHALMDWLQFLGKPTMALFVPTALALWAYGLRRGWDQKKISKIVSDSLIDVGGMIFLFGAAGGFKEVIQATGVGAYIAQQMRDLPLSPVAVAFLVAATMRVALGSATAAILTASALLAGLSRSLPGMETLLVLSVACGVTVATQPADSGFWMIKEYGNVSTSDVILRFNGCRLVMALTGVAILLIVEAIMS